VLVPRNLDDITPDWLTEALAPAFPGGEVTGLSVTDVSYGSACRARLVLDSGPDGSLPHTLIAKGSFTEGLGEDEVAQQWLRLMATLNSAEHTFYTSHAAVLGDRARGGLAARPGRGRPPVVGGVGLRWGRGAVGGGGEAH
jgi:hypothetical protein